ncbi:MAG TPA: ABC transporter permease [Streptomyces sp.]|uniref:ABC transporter permease n=1 Tax=Streptomyces sp. TaxID=1931 RepID=UPI002D6AB92C|nr:ABC transporter permease [Streptomyces sp.]HZG02381.1 ABC transporter permease [Streptomyces sp.]
MTTDTTAAAPPRPARPSGADDGRIGPRAHLRHIGALVRRNVLQIRQDPESMFDVLLMPIVFTLLFVYVFGGALEGSRQEYVNYVVPGLLAMTGLNVAMAVGTGLNEDVRKGVMDRFRSMPIARSSVLVAKVTVELGRMLVATVILLAVGLVLGLEIRSGVPELLAAVGLSMVFGASLMWIFMLLGVMLPGPQAVQGVAFIVLMPLQFGSSIFTDPETMPGWLQAFTEVNPLSNLADAARHLINGEGPVAHPAAVTLLWAVAITAVTAPLAVARFRRAE